MSGIAEANSASSKTLNLSELLPLRELILSLEAVKYVYLNTRRRRNEVGTMKQVVYGTIDKN
jgi:hypothetical protein